MRISDWSSDVCSSDLKPVRWMVVGSVHEDHTGGTGALPADTVLVVHPDGLSQIESGGREVTSGPSAIGEVKSIDLGDRVVDIQIGRAQSELQSLMRISYAVFCLKKKTNAEKKSYHTLMTKNQIIQTKRY